jgi:hypothetical protein
MITFGTLLSILNNGRMGAAKGIKVEAVVHQLGDFPAPSPAWPGVKIPPHRPALVKAWRRHRPRLAGNSHQRRKHRRANPYLYA